MSELKEKEIINETNEEVKKTDNNVKQSNATNKKKTKNTNTKTKNTIAKKSNNTNTKANKTNGTTKKTTTAKKSTTAVKKTNTKKKTETTDKSKTIKNEEEIKDKEKATIVKDEQETKKENVVTLLEDVEENEKTEEKKEEEPKKYNDYEANLNKKSGTDFLHKYTILISVISVLLFIGLIIFSTAFGLSNRKSDKIISGVSIKGIDVSGLTLDEAKEKVTKAYYEKLKQNINLKHNDYETSLIPEQIEAKFGIDEAVEMAYNTGRSGKLLKDNYTIINVNIGKLDINPSFSYNEKALDDFILSTEGNLPDKVSESSYQVENDKLIINKGNKGYIVKKDELKKLILNVVVDINKNEETIEMPVEISTPNEIDLSKIHNEVYKEPKDAYYTKEPFAVYPHENGIDFAISMDEAKKLLETSEQEVIIPLKVTKPNITTNQIGSEAFPDLLASYSTTFSTKNYNRSTNIRLASNKINGTVVLPGKEFSYNTVVGKRTAAARL